MTRNRTARRTPQALALVALACALVLVLSACGATPTPTPVPPPPTATKAPQATQPPAATAAPQATQPPAATAPPQATQPPAAAPTATKAPAAPPTAITAPAAAVSFSKDIMPIFQKSCIRCHGASNPRAGYSLSTYDSTMKNNNVVAGKADSSNLYTLVKSGAMPFGGTKLSAEEIQKIADWINAGAANN